MNISNKIVSSTRRVVSKINAIVGWILFSAGAFVFALGFVVDHEAAILALRITGGSLALSGAVELIISAVFHRAERREQLNLERLKTDGVSYPAEITQIFMHYGVRLRRSFSVYADCTYINRDGKACLVRSQSFLYECAHPYFPHGRMTDGIIPHNENYVARVYVNPHNPNDYAVEIFAQATADYDYRQTRTGGR